MIIFWCYITKFFFFTDLTTIEHPDVCTAASIHPFLVEMPQICTIKRFASTFIIQTTREWNVLHCRQQFHSTLDEIAVIRKPTNKLNSSDLNFDVFGFLNRAWDFSLGILSTKSAAFFLFISFE